MAESSFERLIRHLHHQILPLKEVDTKHDPAFGPYLQRFNLQSDNSTM